MKKPKVEGLLDRDHGSMFPDESLPTAKEEFSIETMKCFSTFSKILKLQFQELDQPLQEFLTLAILGVCQGFEERNLDPGLPEHREVFSHVIKDVKGLIQKITVPSNGKELQSLKKQVFDFGTQWVYYLDWKLYMSKELY
ncbi:MAG: hypothetical protein ACJ0DI_04240 [bacterium]